MRKSIILVMAVGVLIRVATAGGGTVSEPVLVVDYQQIANPDYQYRTAQVAAPPAAKTLKDYLAFFSLNSEKSSEEEFPAAEAETLRMRTKELARQLLNNAHGGLTDEYVLTVNTFVNLNNLYKSSSLGRYLGEQMIGELQAAGVAVIDVRKSNSLMVRERFGEYGLSRDMDELKATHGSGGMVVGTYSYASGQVLVNARVLRNGDGMVISHASLAFDVDKVTEQMLKDEAAPSRPGGLVKIEAGK